MNLDDFRVYLEKQDRSRNTIDTYLRSIRIFFDTYNDVNEQNVIAYKEHLKASYKPKTVNIRLCGLMAYSKFIGQPLSVKGLKIQKALSVENVITPDEFKRLTDGLKADGNERGYWVVKILAGTGARVSEFVRLTKQGLERGYDEMFTKGKVRKIYYPMNIIADSRAYFDNTESDLLFTSIAPNSKGKQLTTSGVSEILQNVGKRYDIRKEVMHPHGFRHYFAKEFLRNGGDITLLSDLLGHDEINTTAIYTRKTTAEMSEELTRRVSCGYTKPISESCTSLSPVDNKVRFCPCCGVKLPEMA